jgi:glycosyltransferase involved in cell wall biosynthesis
MADAHRTFWINGRFLFRNVTGVERVAHELLRALAQACLNTQGEMMHNGQQWSFRIAVPGGEAKDLGPSLYGMPIDRVGRRTGHAWEQLELARFQPQGFLINLCNTAPLFRHRQGIFFHDAQVYAIPGNFNWKFSAWYRVMLNVAGRRAQRLWTNSQFSRSELARFVGLSESRLEVLHLGCDHMRRLDATMPADVQAQLPAGPFALAVSSANPNKNFASVVKALDLLGDAAPPCVIVGQKYAAVFGDAALKSDRIVELGYVTDEALAALYGRAACLTYPSFYEGFGLPPLEAMVFGCPVVSGNRSSLPEVCGDAALYCDPADPASLADGIRRILSQPDLAADLKARGQARAAMFTWQACADRFVSSLASLPA